MKKMHPNRQSGQSSIEFILVLVLVAVITITVISLLGPVLEYGFAVIVANLGNTALPVQPDGLIYDIIGSILRPQPVPAN